MSYKDAGGANVQDNVSFLFTTESSGVAEVNLHDASTQTIYFSYSVDGKRLKY